jgi:hypothetical protein
MARRVCPVKQGHGTDVYAYSVARADFPVNGNAGAVYAQLLRRLNWPPYAVSLMLAHDFSVLLEIRVYRQTLPPQTRMKALKY